MLSGPSSYYTLFHAPPCHRIKNPIIIKLTRCIPLTCASIRTAQCQILVSRSTTLPNLLRLDLPSMPQYPSLDFPDLPLGSGLLTVSSPYQLALELFTLDGLDSTDGDYVFVGVLTRRTRSHGKACSTNPAPRDGRWYDRNALSVGLAEPPASRSPTRRAAGTPIRCHATRLLNLYA